MSEPSFAKKKNDGVYLGAQYTERFSPAPTQSKPLWYKRFLRQRNQTAKVPLHYLAPSTGIVLNIYDPTDGDHGITEHGVRDREGESGAASHPPAGAQIGQFDPQHLHNHLVVQGQVEVMLVSELGCKSEDVIPNHIEFRGAKDTDVPIWSTTQFHILILSQFGIYVTKNPARLDSNWMHISNALDIYSMLLQEPLNVTVFCQNSNLDYNIRFD